MINSYSGHSHASQNDPKQPSSGFSLNGGNEDRPVLLRPESGLFFRCIRGNIQIHTILNHYLNIWPATDAVMPVLC